MYILVFVAAHGVHVSRTLIVLTQNFGKWIKKLVHVCVHCGLFQIILIARLVLREKGRDH